MTEDHDSSSLPGPSGGAVSGGPDGTPGRVRRRRWPWVVFVVAVVAIGVASRIDLNYYALQPGTAQSVQQFITVPPDRSHPVHHPVLLTDVVEARVSVLTYLYFQLSANTQLVQADEITGATPASELGAQGALEMSQAENAAKVAALRRLGYPVPATPAGAVITGTLAGTPAYDALSVGDVVTAVDGTPTLSATALVTALHHYHSGQTVVLTVRRGGTAAPGPVRVTLKTTVVNQGTNPGGKGPYATVDLGIISPEDQVDFTFPFPVRIDVTNIGGPSAGLAMTLGVIDALEGGSLTGGRTVAATGTIDDLGNVGPVGGVQQKTVAVENAGATIFLVPPLEYKDAIRKDRPGLKVYAVSTLDQALAVLAAHGGTVPSRSATVPPATPTTTAG